ncbi:MAG: helix-turn-helix transcriptional regulator [Oscillospiraceae bacterium]
MNEDFIRNRITELRVKKGISEYRMSNDLGHSKSYIQSITSGRALPSLSEFLYICEYLEISPKCFFDDEIDYPIITQKLIDQISKMPENDLILIFEIAERLIETSK